MVVQKKIIIAHVMGYNSKKFGGLEKYMLELFKASAKQNIQIIPIYNSTPKSQEYLLAMREIGMEFKVSNALAPLSFLRFFRTFIKNYHPILIHSHFQPLLPGLYGHLFGVKHRWNTVRLMLVNKNLREVQIKEDLKLSSRLYRFLIHKYNNRFFAVSQAVNNQFKKIYPKQDSKFSVLYNGSSINLNSKKQAREDLNFNDDYLYICCIAFASKTKGVDVLIKAANLLKESKIPFRICLIGLAKDNSFTAYLYKLIVQYKLENYILDYGIVNNVPELLPAMDIFVQPSRSESLSNSIIEAGLAGLPAIGSNVGGIPEVIINGKTGLLFEVENHKELADKISNLLENKSLRKEMGNASRKHKLDHFLMKDKIQDLINLYLFVINGK
jgi:glycosyltransferase involved in cell wall biosynthesis